MISDVSTRDTGQPLLPDFGSNGTDLETWTPFYWAVSDLTEDEVGSNIRQSRAVAHVLTPSVSNCIQASAGFAPSRDTHEEITEFFFVLSHPGLFQDGTSCEPSAEAREDSTTGQSEDGNVIENTRQIFGNLTGLESDDEGDDRFEEPVRSLVYSFGRRAVCEIDHLIHNGHLPPDAIRFTLRVLGDIEHPETHGYRRWLLQRVLLGSSAPVIRDGANVGLSLMDDPKAIPTIKEAITKERSPLVSKLLKRTLYQLEETAESVSLLAKGRS